MAFGRAPLTVALEDVCFLHWPVSADALADRLPGWLDPDEADGSAWIGALPMTMASFDAFGLPVRTGVEALNCRTYVTGPTGERGVYFLALDATDRPAVEAARRLFRLPYHHAAIDRRSDGDGTVVDVTRLTGSRPSMRVSFEPSGPTRTASPDSLPAFLTERYRYFAEGPLGTRLVGSVGHDPWRLRSASATVRDGGLLADAFGLSTPDSAPLAHYSSGTRMTIGPPRPL